MTKANAHQGVLLIELITVIMMTTKRGLFAVKYRAKIVIGADNSHEYHTNLDPLKQVWINADYIAVFIVAKTKEISKKGIKTDLVGVTGQGQGEAENKTLAH